MKIKYLQIVKLIMVLVSFVFLTPPLSAEPLPQVLEGLDTNLVFPGTLKKWTLKNRLEAQGSLTLQWENIARHEILLKHHKVSGTTLKAAFQTVGEQIDKQLKQKGGNILTIKEFLAVVLLKDTPSFHSVNMLYATPDGIFWWKYKVPASFKTDYDKYTAGIIFAARAHQYKTALKHGNVIMGRWGGPVHEFAKLLSAKKDPEARHVYKHLLQTSPSNYDAQMEYAAITENQNEKEQCAGIVLKGAEEEELLNTAAEILGQKPPLISSFPLLSTEDNGLKVVLIPLNPCNPWLLDDIAQTYEKITQIPVVIRRLPVLWTPPEPTRSAYRPYLEKMAAGLWKTRSDFKKWPLAKLKDEIMKKAEQDGPQAVAYVKQVFEKMEAAGCQWDAAPLMNRLSKDIVPFYSKDPETMIVGITELDIFSGESNFVFSLFGGLKEIPVSVMSYARMRAKLTGGSQSRERLIQRAAKELVPASLKKLNIPRPMDPSCPYSYSSGMPRLDEKTLVLSEPVKKEIERIKSSRTDCQTN